MFTQQMGVHQDLELQEYVQRVGEKLAAVSERPELEWHFTIVDTDDVNAFATMGGYVYISRGILPYFENEADLAAVLGHEIGHISAEHLKKQQHKGMLSGLASAATAIFTGMPALADLTNMAGQAIISGYGREAELEADRLGARYLAKAGYDPHAMIHVISTLKDQDTFERERARLEGREPRIYHGVFASHPSNDTRLQQAVASAGQNEAAATGNTQNAEGFLQAVEGLPVGSSARQGMVRETASTTPTCSSRWPSRSGWQVANQPDKILAIAPQKEHVPRDPRRRRRPRTSPTRATSRCAGSRTGGSTHTETLDINGLKAWTGVVRGEPSPFGQATNVRYIIIYYANLMWIFKGASRAGTVTPVGRPVLPLDREHVPAHARQRVRARRAVSPARHARDRRHDHGEARRGKPDQEVSAAAAAALQQPLPGRRAKARRPRQDRPLGDCHLCGLWRKGDCPLLYLTIPPASSSPPAPPAPAPRWLTRFLSASGISAAVIVAARDDEERVVAETARAAALEADLAFPGRLRDDRRGIAGLAHEDHRTAIARAAARGRNACELRKQLFVVRARRRLRVPRSAPCGCPGGRRARPPRCRNRRRWREASRSPRRGAP